MRLRISVAMAVVGLLTAQAIATAEAQTRADYYAQSGGIRLASCDDCDNGGESHCLSCDDCDDSCDDSCDSSCDSCDGCDGGCSSCGCGGILPCKTGDAISLFDLLMGDCHESCLDVGGWVQVGYHNYNTGMFNNYPNNAQLHQAWGFIGKEADGECGFDWGFRFDYLYGTDGPDTQAFGNPPGTWDEGWDAGNFYGHAIPQLYVEGAYGDLSVKVGHFYTIAGYEVVQATGNFFYSHAFTMYNNEPFTHTGALATYSGLENVEVYGGWTKGWDTGFETNGGDIFLGGLSVSMTDDVTLIYTNTFGKIGFGTNATGYSHSVVLDVTLTEKLNYVFQTDYSDYNGQPFGFEGLIDYTFNRYGINQYLFYNVNDCLAAGLRFEWFNAEQSTLNFVGQPIPGRRDLYALTFGLNYKPHPNVNFRPEIRYDKDDEGFIVEPSRNDTVGFGVDMVLTF